MEDRWQHKGHPRGQCIVSPCERFAMVSISKNSSSYWEVWLEQLDWTIQHHRHIPQAATVLVPLRNPVDRWVAGISEYCFLYHNDFPLRNEVTKRLFEDRVVFDDHTECQCYFYDCFDVNDHVYFNSNDPQSTWTYLKQHMSIPTESYLLDPINYTEDPVNAQRKDWKNWILKTIDLNKIKQFYTQHDAKTYAHLADLNDR